MLSEKRLKRLRREVEWLIKLPAAARRESLSLLADREGVGYDTVKKDLYALAYAVIPGNVPESYEQDASRIRRAIEKGLLDKEKCASAAMIFLEHDPEFDLSRLDLTGVTDPELEEIKSLVLEYARRTARLKAERLGWHPAREKAELWKIAGAKLYSELPKAVEESEPSTAFLAVKNVWEDNLVRVQASWHYELAMRALAGLSARAGWTGILNAVKSDEVTLDRATVEWVSENAPKDPESTRLLARFLEQVRAGRKILASRAKQF